MAAHDWQVIPSADKGLQTQANDCVEFDGADMKCQVAECDWLEGQGAEIGCWAEIDFPEAWAEGQQELPSLSVEIEIEN